MAERVSRRFVNVVVALWLLAGLAATLHSAKQYISVGQADRIKISNPSNGRGTKYTKSLNPIQDVRTSETTRNNARSDSTSNTRTSEKNHSNTRSDPKSNGRTGIAMGGSIVGGIAVAFAAIVGSTAGGVPAARAMDESMKTEPTPSVVQQTSDAVSSTERALRGLEAVSEARARDDVRGARAGGDVHGVRAREDVPGPRSRFEIDWNDPRHRMPWEPNNRPPWQRDNSPLATLTGQNRLPWERDNSALAALTGQSNRLPWEKDENPLSRLATTLITPPRGLPWESYDSPLAALLDIKRENPLEIMSEKLSEGRMPWQEDRMPWEEEENPLDVLNDDNRLPWEKGPVEELLDGAKETVVPLAAVGGGIAAFHKKKTEGKKGTSFQRSTGTNPLWPFG